MVDDGYPDGSGAPMPGVRTRRRGALPGADAEPVAPVGHHESPAVVADEDGLRVTEKQKLPEAKVWGLRVSEQHYQTGRTLAGALSTRYRQDQRQVGELIVQFLWANRFQLDQYVQQKVGPAVNLDIFTNPDGQ